MTARRSDIGPRRRDPEEVGHYEIRMKVSLETEKRIKELVAWSSMSRKALFELWTLEAHHKMCTQQTPKTGT